MEKEGIISMWEHTPVIFYLHSVILLKADIHMFQMGRAPLLGLFFIVVPVRETTIQVKDTDDGVRDYFTITSTFQK